MYPALYKDIIVAGVIAKGSKVLLNKEANRTFLH